MSVDKGQKLNLFGGGSDLQSVADEIYGGSAEIPDSGRVVARPTSIMSIWRDPKQPRRAIPSTISMHNDGNPLEVVPMLQQWQAVAEEAAGVPIHVEALLNGEGEGLDTDKFPSVTQEFLALVGLAAHIKEYGLENPITIIESDGKLLIEAGERRFLAYQLLHVYLGAEWAKIPAIKADGKDAVWRQAGENTQRRQLNAISMARQLALLIMAARVDGQVTAFDYLEYGDVVKSGGCDRRYYAQIADGNVHRIPGGLAEKIQTAMALSESQLAHYRKLLRLTTDEQLNDILWTRADVESWPERVLRDVATFTTVKVQEVVNRPNWTLDDLKALKEVPQIPFPSTSPLRVEGSIPRRPVTSEWMHKRVMTKSNQVGTVVDVDGDLIKVLLPSGQKQLFHFEELTLMGDRPSAAPNVPAPQAQPKIELGDTVKTRAGSIGPVVQISGRALIIRVPGRGDLRQNIEDVTLVGKGAASKPDDDFDFPFLIGSQVVTKFGRVLIVVGFKNGGAGTLVHSDPKETPWMIPTAELTAYKEPVIDEDDIEEDVDPDAPAPQRQWREGWAEDIAGSTPLASDKADSGQSTVEPTSIFNAAIHREFLGAAATLALANNDGVTAELLMDFTKMTDQQAIALATEDKLKPMLDSVYDAVAAYLADILQQVMDAAAD